LFGGDGTSKYPNVPACLIQLFCPQHVAESTGITSDGFDLWWDYGIMPIHGIKLLVPYHQKSNTGLPMMATSGFALYNSICPVTKPLHHGKLDSQPMVKNQTQAYL
jgi:hypothetical protein